MAASKALASTESSPGTLVLGADTIVSLAGQALGKPADSAHAREMLNALCGRTHEVITGVALARHGELAWLGDMRTSVKMRPYLDDEINQYVMSGRGSDKAGGYAIQDAEFRPVERIEGCYPNVIGLPLCAVVQALGSVGVQPPAPIALAPAIATACALCYRTRELFAGE